MYGIQMWVTASASPILKLYRDSRVKCSVDAPRYMPNYVIERDLKIPSIREEIRRNYVIYHKCVVSHPKELAGELTGNTREVR